MLMKTKEKCVEPEGQKWCPDAATRHTRGDLNLAAAMASETLILPAKLIPANAGSNPIRLWPIFCLAEYRNTLTR
jgi:hypothetical protein